MGDVNEISIEDVDALARKLGEVTDLDDHDREVFVAVFALARAAVTGGAEVSGFGMLMCSCPGITSGGRFKYSPTCAIPPHASAATRGWG